MKKNNVVLLYVILAVLVLFILPGMIYQYISSARYISFLFEDIAKRDALIVGLDSTIVGLRTEIADLQSAKDDLARKLDGETFAKEVVRGNLNTLDERFMDATRESMRVEGNLTHALNGATTALNGATAEQYVLQSQMTSLQQEFFGKVWTQREVYLLDLADKTARVSAVEAEAFQLNTELRKLQGELSTIKQDKFFLEADLKQANDDIEGLIARLEDYFLVNARKLDISYSRSLTPVIFLPADVKLSADTENSQKKAIDRAMKITQVWFHNQLGDITFAVKEPIIFRGAKNSDWYKAMPANIRITLVHAEISSNAPGEDGYVVFMYGVDDPKSYGAREIRVAMISSVVVRNLLGQDIWRYSTMAVVAHEIGHVFGLRHSNDGNKSAIMRVDSAGMIEAHRVFPLATFSEQEKNILRNAIRKE